MDRLTNLFQLIVDTLIESDPSRLHRPMAIGTLCNEVVPYRVARAPLDLDCAEDHEMLLLRLMSGEGKLVQVADAQAVEAFQQEVVSVNPDLRVLEVFADIELSFDARALAKALGAAPSRAYRPPEEDLPHEDQPVVADLPVEVAGDPAGDIIREPELVPSAEEHPDLEPTELIVEGQCGFCGGVLPEGRTVVFCPHCGQGLQALRCTHCGAELELGWKHCITCGTAT